MDQAPPAPTSSPADRPPVGFLVFPGCCPPLCSAPGRLGEARALHCADTGHAIGWASLGVRCWSHPSGPDVQGLGREEPQSRTGARSRPWSGDRGPCVCWRLNPGPRAVRRRTVQGPLRLFQGTHRVPPSASTLLADSVPAERVEVLEVVHGNTTFAVRDRNCLSLHSDGPFTRAPGEAPAMGRGGSASPAALGQCPGPPGI